MYEANNIINLDNYLYNNDILIPYINNGKFDLLIYAIKKNFPIHTIENIISHYLDLNYTIFDENVDNFRTPLYLCIIKYKFPIAKLLLKYGADMDYKINSDYNIITSLLHQKGFSPSITKFVLFSNDYVKTPQFNSFIVSLIKENDDDYYFFMEMVLRYVKAYYSSNISILKFLNFYKNKTALSKKQIIKILNERWK
eukprot:jgi/Orpsp1_1/1176164/evm.model.c7180000056621.1